VVFCANAGDSRAVLYSMGHKLIGMQVQPLTTDHKPSTSFEKQRIRAMNGRVQAIRNPQGKFIGPDRVWLKEKESPGLAMSRSIGDEIAHTIGVSENPEVFRFDLAPEDKFIVIASDGVWEFMTNEEIG
jgi:serine/threonine protein phosphatase PrpC